MKLFNTAILIFISHLSILAQGNNDILENLIHHPELKHAGIGIEVLDQNNKSIISYNPDLNLIPASTLKVLTTIGALEVLGKEFSYTTDITYTNTVEQDGTLIGDLILNASGDPTLCSSYIDGPDLDAFCKKIYDALMEHHIKCIDGSLTINLPKTIRPAIHDTWLWQDIANYYAGGAHTFNIIDNSYNLYIDTNGGIGSSPSLLSINPEVPQLTFTNKLIIDESHTGDKSYIFGGPDQNNKTIHGSLPQKKTPYKIKGAIHNPAHFFLTYLRSYLTEKNIKIHNINITHNDNHILGKSILHIESPHLPGLIKVINERSVNLYAEALLNSVLTAIEVETPDEVLDHLSAKWNLNLNGHIIHDGSGLSSRNSISAKVISEVLNKAKDQPWFRLLTESLAEGGKEGTLKNMFLSDDKSIQVFAKSGSMSSVRCYTGYIFKDKKYKYAFTIMVNNYTMKDRQLKKLIQDLVLNLAKSPE